MRLVNAVNAAKLIACYRSQIPLRERQSVRKKREENKRKKVWNGWQGVHNLFLSKLLS